MSQVLAAADDRSLTIVVVSSLKDVAGLLRREEALFVRKVKEVVIQGGVKPFDQAEPLRCPCTHCKFPTYVPYNIPGAGLER